MNELKRKRTIEKLLDQEKDLNTLAGKLSDVAQMLYTCEDNPQLAEMLVTEALRLGEKQFIKLKENAALILDQRDLSPYEIYGTTTDFPAGIEKIDSDRWKIHLPIFSPTSATRRKSGDGRYMYYLVSNLLREYQKRNRGSGEQIKLLKQPLVIFKYHIRPERKLVFDFDNVDSKSALDAMQGYFFTDDSAFSITTIQKSIRSEDSYTDIFVMEKPEGFL